MDPIIPQPKQLQYSAPEQKHFLNKKFIVTFVILVLLGTTAYAGIWWWGNQQVAELPFSCPKGVPMACTNSVPPHCYCASRDSITDWQTYRNEKYGFEIKIPSDWTVTPSQDYPNAPELFFTPNDKSTIIWFSNGPYDPSFSGVQQTEMINGVIWTTFYSEVNGWNFGTTHNGVAFQFNRKGSLESKIKLETFLSTFKFTK